MKLIYFYLGKCNGIDFSLDVNLSEDKYLKITNYHTLEIQDLEYNIQSGFYGENIINVSAIVGQNGSGKSSILNILGLNKQDLSGCYPDSQWLAVYEHEDSYFLEGLNIENILNIESITKTPSHYVAYKLIRINNILSFDSFIQDHANIQHKYGIIHKPDFLNNINKTSARNINDNDDRNYGFKRNYLKYNIANFYEFITNNEGEFCSHLSKKNIILKIQKSQNRLLKDNVKFYPKLDRYLRTEIFKKKIDKIQKISDHRKLFIIDLLEEYIMFIIENIHDPKNSKFCHDLIELNKYIDDIFDYNKIKIHLFSLIDKLINTLSEKDDGIVCELGKPDWNNILRIIKKNNELFFFEETNGLKDDIICHICLAQYNSEIYHFISTLTSIHMPMSLTLPNMSSGEYDFNKKIAGLNKALKLTINSNPDIKGFIIILDEYDEHLHPEWSRCFLDYLLQYLQEYYNKYEFQIILSTHSPYIISDLLKENVIKIKHNPIEDSYISEKAKHSFASNIYDIINDSFFLSQPIGKFAVRKINNILSQINTIDENGTSEIYEDTHLLISNIDDDYIRETLLTQLDKKYNFDEGHELKKIENEIKFLNNKRDNILRKMNGEDK